MCLRDLFKMTIMVYLAYEYKLYVVWNSRVLSSVHTVEILIVYIHFTKVTPGDIFV